MELNAEQIKKALECCKSPKLTKCDGCPREKENGHCMYRLNEDALALITSQEQRIKELTEKVVSLLCDKAEIKLLQKHIESLADTIERQEQEMHSIKADTVRKMHSEINKTLSALCKGDVSEIHRIIDQIAKEMLEGEK